MSEIEVNGQCRPVADGTTVGDVVASVTSQESGCAVAVNGEVVPRHDWPTHAVRAGDRVEILTAVQGG
jgi:sulfur carrier protein